MALVIHCNYYITILHHFCAAILLLSSSDDSSDSSRAQMNALSVQNPLHKCDLGNKNNSVENNCRQYLTVIIIITILILKLYYICVHVLPLTLQVVLRLHNSSKRRTVLKST